MTIAAKVTPLELGEQVTTRYAGQYLSVKLLDTAGLAYTPGLQDPLQYVIDYEIPRASGYLPQVFGYEANDVLDYADFGVGLRQKQVIFQHDGGVNSYSFDSLSVQWAGGVVLGVEVDSGSSPGTLVDGVYQNVIVGNVSGEGQGLAVNFEVFDGSIVSITVHSRGYDYNVLDDLEISSGVLSIIGAHDGSGGAQGINVTSVYNASNPGGVVLIAPTANVVTLTSGNESAVYFNYKNFGFYNTSS